MEHPFPEEDLFVQLARPNNLLPPQSVTFPSNIPRPLLLMHDFHILPSNLLLAFLFGFAPLLSLLVPSAAMTCFFLLYTNKCCL